MKFFVCAVLLATAVVAVYGDVNANAGAGVDADAAGSTGTGAGVQQTATSGGGLGGILGGGGRNGGRNGGPAGLLGGVLGEGNGGLLRPVTALLDGNGGGGGLLRPVTRLLDGNGGGGVLGSASNTANLLGGSPLDVLKVNAAKLASLVQSSSSSLAPNVQIDAQIAVNAVLGLY